jgi:hypothetical protein
VPGSISISVASQLAIATDIPAFALQQANQFGNAVGGGHLYVLSNDGSGYVVDMESTNYVSPMTSTPIPASDVSSFTNAVATANLGSVQQFVTSSALSGSQATPPTGTPSGWDGWTEDGFFLNTVPTLPAGDYSGANAFAGTVSFTLWGN